MVLTIKKGRKLVQTQALAKRPRQAKPQKSFEQIMEERRRRILPKWFLEPLMVWYRHKEGYSQRLTGMRGYTFEEDDFISLEKFTKKISKDFGLKQEGYYFLSHPKVGLLVGFIRKGNKLQYFSEGFKGEQYLLWGYLSYPIEPQKIHPPKRSSTQLVKKDQGTGIFSSTTVDDEEDE